MDQDDFFRDFRESQKRSNLYFNIFLGVFCVLGVFVLGFIIYVMFRVFVLKKPVYGSKF